MHVVVFSTCAYLTSHLRGQQRLITHLCQYVYHPPFVTKVSLFCPQRAKESSVAFCYSRGDYLGLYKFLEQFNWLKVLNDEIVDSATERLSSIVKNTLICLFRNG